LLQLTCKYLSFPVAKLTYLKGVDLTRQGYLC